MPMINAEELAEKILRAAGSGLKHYMPKTKEEILAAAQSIIDKLAVPE